MEKIGVHKRDILTDRVVDARSSQKEARDQFGSALEQFKSVVKVDETNIDKVYKKLESEYSDSKQSADEIRKRIDAIESVGDALFKEWRQELKQYSSASLRANSQKKYERTKRTYGELIKKMRLTENRLQPVLAAMNDQVLYLKHNLNTQAIASLKQEVVKIDRDVDSLMSAINDAIAQADEFIKQMKS